MGQPISQIRLVNSAGAQGAPITQTGTAMDVNIASGTLPNDLTVFASAARVATPTPYDGENIGGTGLNVVMDVTASAATPSVVVTIQGKDLVSGKFYTILASAAFTGGVETRVLRVGPSLVAAANLAATAHLPRYWRVIVTHSDADSITYSVGASLMN